MIETLNIFGQWFLPSKPEYKVSGTLNFTPTSNIELDVAGMFGDLLLGPDRYPIILGETNVGKVTLVDIFARKRSKNHSRYQSVFFLKGNHYPSEEELKFDSCIADLFGLDVFLDAKGIDFEPLDSVRKWELKYDAEAPTIFLIPDKFKTSLVSEGTVGFEGHSKVDIRRITYAKYDYFERIPFREIIKDIGKFWGFISLCNNETSFPTKIFMKDTDEGNVEVVYKNTFYQEQTKNWFRSIINVKDFGDGFEEAIQQWYKLYSEIGHILNLRLYHFKDKRFFSVDRFIDMTRTLESFHRLKRKNERVNPREYEEFLNKVKAIELDEKFKRLLNDRLNYGNEPTFKTRLMELFNEVPTSLMELIDEDGKLAKVVKDTRNYYTHYGEELKAKLPSTGELMRITDNLEMIISLLLLKEIGFSTENFAVLVEGRGLFKKWRKST